MSRSRFEVSWDVRARLTATDRRSWAISKAFGRGPSARRPPYLLQNCAHTGRLVDAASAVNVWGLGQTLAVPCYRHNIQKNTITAKGGVVKTGCLCYRTRLPRLWLWVFFYSESGGICAVWCECCLRFPLRRQNKEATRSTPRTRRPVYQAEGTC